MHDKIQRLRRMGLSLALEKIVAKLRRPALRFISNQGWIPPLPTDLAALLVNGFAPAAAIEKGKPADHPAIMREFFKNAPGLLGFATRREILLELLHRHCPEDRPSSIAAADRVCLHIFNFFESGDYRFGKEIDWHLDYTTGKRWPLCFYEDVPYRGPMRPGDVKYPWELSRHQYFSTLGKAYWYTGDEKYAREFVEEVESWITANPIYRGIHWVSALEPALRIISWVLGYSFFRDSSQITPRFFSLFLRSLWSQARFIERHLTRGFYENNHLVGEAAGLFLAGIFLAGFKRAEHWKNLGREILLEQIVKQTHSDGVNVEQAFHYHLFSLDFFLLFKLLHEQTAGPVPRAVDERLDKMFAFLLHTRLPGGGEPAYGDSDNARVFQLKSGEHGGYEQYLGVAAALYGRADCKWLAETIGEELILLLGKQGCVRFAEVSPRPPENSSIYFPQGGYCVSRDKWAPAANFVLFDCGPLGYGSGGHGHADMLSVMLVVNGQEVLVDPGTYAYNLDQTFRNYFRSTCAHNTITVDGEDQAIIIDRMAWDRIPRCTMIDSFFSEFFDVMIAEHDGYNRLEPPVTHRRIVLFCKDPIYFIIIDQLESQGPHRYSLHYHFPPGVSILEGQDVVIARLDKASQVMLKMEASELIEKSGDCSKMESRGGWFSRMYGHKIPSPSLTFSASASAGMHFMTYIAPCNGTQRDWEACRIQAASEQDCWYLEVRNGRIHDKWIIHPDIRSTTRNGVTFAGRMCLVRQGMKGGSDLSIHGRDAMSLIISGATHFSSGTPVSGPLTS